MRSHMPGFLVLLALNGSLVLGSHEEAQEQQQQQQQQRKQDEEQKTPPEVPVTFSEIVVVTASRVEQQLIDAPATMSVLPSQNLESSPAQNYGDLLRSVPGLNVTQLSARDVNLTSRAATNTLATSQLALLDGRSIYLDFFGFIAWDFLPVNTNEIKQIEVIRGPASAVWGANALTGVVNILTKSPREMQGTTVTLGAGAIDRSAPGNDLGTGSLFYVNGSHAQAVNDRLAFRVSAGVYTSDPLPRPVGAIPNGTGTQYPSFENQGTTQPKVDARVDYDFADGKQHLVFGAGVAGTEGIIHTGIGPFDIQSGTALGYGKVNYSNGNFKLNFFVNILNGEAPALLAVGADGRPINFLFDTQTYDIEFGNFHVFAGKHLLSYGGNYRRNNFSLSIAPRGDNRNELGGYLQDEIFISDHFRWVIGARVDKFDVIDDPVFSPRTTFVVKPTRDHAFRVSYNKAFQSPSLVNNFLDTTILNQLNLGAINPALAGILYVFPTRAVGEENLKEASLDAYEVSYTGTFGGKATVSAAYYINDSDDGISFVQTGAYRSGSPPPRWPLPPAVLDLLAAAGRSLPSEFSYRNLPKLRNQGIELGLDTQVNSNWSFFANYSWQDDPDPSEGYPESELNFPPQNRFNLGAYFNYPRVFGNVAVNWTDEAFWTDVLDFRFAGPTDSYTLLNVGFGVRWANGKVTTSIKATNLANQDVQQHVFGDFIKRQVIGELRFSF
jgi:outer membrane receptor protein involved in Fe transport